MNIQIDMRKLCSLPVLRRKIGWENISEEIRSERGHAWPVFCVNPDSPELRRIYLFANPDYDGIFQVDFGDDGFHCHMEGYSGDWEWRNTWQAIKLARGLVSEKLTVLETLDGAGRVKGWEVLPFACWPNTVLRSDCERLQPGVKNPLVDLEGNGWRPPHYRRIVFNRRPFVDTPDWRRYVPVPCGWMSPERWELVRRVEESLGIPKPNRLT